MVARMVDPRTRAVVSLLIPDPRYTTWRPNRGVCIVGWRLWGMESNEWLDMGTFLLVTIPKTSMAAPRKPNFQLQWGLILISVKIMDGESRDQQGSGRSGPP